jgi:hypothetical protein
MQQRDHTNRFALWHFRDKAPIIDLQRERQESAGDAPLAAA